MKEITFWIIVVLAVLLCIPIGLLIPGIPNSVGAYVLFLTLVAVLLYTRETHKLRILSKRQIELSQEQMELSLKPHLEIVFRRAHFRLHNIGHGPAVRVQIDDEIVSPARYDVRLRFICPTTIKKDECLPIEIKILTVDGKHEDGSTRLAFITPPQAIETFGIKVHYENLMNKRYDHALKIGKDMPIDSDPVDFLLQYLYEKAPNGINPKEIPAHYVKPADLPKHLQYCMDKKLAEADRLVDQERIEESRNLRITSDGIDYIERKG